MSDKQQALPRCPFCGADGIPAQGSWAENYECGSARTNTGVYMVDDTNEGTCKEKANE